ncbi:Hypothetical predicted protein, partial [Pelobates cultripes]
MQALPIGIPAPVLCTLAHTYDFVSPKYHMDYVLQSITKNPANLMAANHVSVWNKCSQLQKQWSPMYLSWTDRI